MYNVSQCFQLVANQQTVMELLGFFTRILPPNKSKKSPTESPTTDSNEFDETIFKIEDQQTVLFIYCSVTLYMMSTHSLPAFSSDCC